MKRFRRILTVLVAAGALTLAGCGGVGGGDGAALTGVGLDPGDGGDPGVGGDPCGDPAGGTGSQTGYRSYTSNINPSNVVVIDTDLAGTALRGQPATEQVQADEAHEVATGEGLVVAVLDGGFTLSSPLVLDRMLPVGYDAVDDDSDPEDLGNGIDDDGDCVIDNAVGHGTFVAGMVLMAAPDAMILAVRVVDDEGRGTNEQLQRGLEFAIAMDVDVINLSLETDQKAHVKHLLTTAREMGIIIVASAGNSGADDLDVLAESDDTIAVGAVDGADVLSEFTNEPGQPKEVLDVLAPGVDLLGPLGAPDDGSMGTWSGTSFSAGIVSGAAAIYLELNPDATPDMVATAIASSTDPVVDADGIPQPFPGRLNLATLVTQ